jgi:alanyl-tRNA synthetase
LIQDEEVSFGRTIDRGIELFEEAADRALFGPASRSYSGSRSGKHSGSVAWSASGPKSRSGRAPTISAEDAFKLHDTYGFPIDLTRIMAEERGMTVDIAGFEKLMEQARQLARAGGKEGESRLFELPPDVLAALHKSGVNHTDDSAKFNAMPIGAMVKAIWDGSRLIEHTHGAEAAERGVAVILDQTCFYAEMGGQVGDTGELRSQGGAVMAVQTTRASGGYVLHVGNMEQGHLRVGDHVTATLAGVRPRTEKNHTATHLANWALREVLGEGVQQKGSLVDPDKLRFDFSHAKPMSEDEVAKVEELVEQRVEQDLPVYGEEAPQEQALKINGLRAVFGEKYPPVVRVVSIGAPVEELLKNPSHRQWREYSVEFCGGTHLKTTGEVGAFVVTGEELVSKGVRRIVALTGDTAREVQERGHAIETMVAEARAVDDSDLALRIASLQKSVSAGDLPLRARRRVQAVIAELQDRYKKWEKASRAQSAAKLDVGDIAARLLSSATPIGPGKLIVADVPGATQDQLLSVTDSLKKQAGSYGILLGSASDGKVSFVAAVSDDLIAKGLKAGDWVREAAKATGGGGGGRPQLAQAGGKDPAKLAEALDVAREYARRLKES